MRKFLIFFICFLLGNIGFSTEHLHPDTCSLVVQDPPIWKVRWNLAKVLGYAQRYEEAEEQYKKLIEEDPDFFEVQIELANLFLTQFTEETPESTLTKPVLLKQALTILEKIPLKALDESTKLMMAEIYLREGELKEAELIYKKYLDSFPKNLKVRLNLASIYTINQQYDEAAMQYEYILKRRPQDKQVRRKYALVLVMAKDNKKAIEELKETL